MAGRVRPAPTFPSDFQSKSYREWRLEVTHWVWDMRRQQVAESLLAGSFRESLKTGAGGVHNNALLIDPRIWGHNGRPKYTYGPYDPGELSGVVWYIEKVLDHSHQHVLSQVNEGLWQ